MITSVVRIISLCTILLSATWLNSFAQINQTKCGERFEIAQQLYQDGKLSQVIDTLKVCLEENGDPRHKDILSLTAATYKFLDEDANAKTQLLNLFSENPFYILDQSIPELVYIENELIIYPKWTLNGKVGAFLVNRPLVTNWNALEGVVVVDESFGLESGDPIGFRTEFTLGYSLFQEGPYLYAGLGLSRYSFRYTGEFLNVTNTEGNSDQATISFREKHWWVNVPIYIKKYLGVDKDEIRNKVLLPYAYFGASLDILSRSSAEWIGPRVAYTGIEDGTAIPLDDVPIGELRNQFNYSLMGGVGMNARSGVHSFFVELGYTHMFRKLNRKGVANTEIALQIAEELHYQGNDFQLANLALNIGYTRFFFKAEERK